MNTAEPFVDIPTLSEFLEGIGSHHQDLVFTPQSLLKQGSVMLYHYTDLGGFMGIVKDHDLWLTHSQYLNDTEEMILGTNLVNAAIATALSQNRWDISYLQELQRLTSSREGVYICCFCEKDNLLSQWRGYAANGSGVSLQFAPKQFADVSGPDNVYGLLRFWKVFYQPAVQSDIIQRAIDDYAPNNPNRRAPAVTSPTELARKAADAIRFFIPTFKNSDFQEEAEWRLIFTPAPSTQVQPKFRVRGNMLVPYYSLRDLIQPGILPLLPLQGVCVGPGTHKQINAESAEALLRKSGYSAVSVSVSNTSYRA